jgi:hypothetical protein
MKLVDHQPKALADVCHRNRSPVWPGCSLKWCAGQGAGKAPTPAIDATGPIQAVKYRSLQPRPDPQNLKPTSFNPPPRKKFEFEDFRRCPSVIPHSSSGSAQGCRDSPPAVENMHDRGVRLSFQRSSLKGMPTMYEYKPAKEIIESVVSAGPDFVERDAEAQSLRSHCPF